MARDVAGSESGVRLRGGCFLVEEPEVPKHMRQAASTENGSFVAGLKRYFDLMWEYESSARWSKPLN